VADKRIRLRSMIGRGVRLPTKMLDAILDRWIEIADGQGAPHRRLDGEPWIDRAGYVEPSELLWACTVGCKLQKCRAQLTDPNDPCSVRMPVVEQVLRLNAAISEYQNVLGWLRPAIQRLHLSRKQLRRTGRTMAKSTLHRLARMESRERIMTPELGWAEGRVKQLVGTSDYRDGRAYLAQAFTEAILDDPEFAAWSWYAYWLVSPEVLLKPAMRRLGITPTQLAERLGLSYETVRRWLSSSDSRRYVRIPIKYAPVLRELLLAA
jgi:hypothetical protein